MTLLSYDRYCDEIVVQADLLGSCFKDADLAAPVPSCPGWSAGRLVRHLGDVQRWAGSVARGELRALCPPNAARSAWDTASRRPSSSTPGAQTTSPSSKPRRLAVTTSAADMRGTALRSRP
jgi:hypothetical protein